eukprot:CAMPEP_0195512200 /NCGR_PEP_ID=MMETSP0794_2-20130614/4238_1 /TAXON_ID=515487 /ORGANISM="Stephanopyxis turris, Strain CCMP 815" /LENGTH=267 /DNA_ID=CAMNT_0040639929 /DNA_START=225 /DNA_END=1028 /DNA_ORIENTATION=+
MASKLLLEYDNSDFSATWEFQEADMRRKDESDDSDFYSKPRFQRHVDEWALLSLKSFYRDEILSISSIKEQNGDKREVDILDLCSSWISHLPTDNEPNPPPMGVVAGVGMNMEELEANPQLNSWHVQDLNQDAILKQTFDDESFDLILNTCSVDYLTNPKEVFEEMHRVLRPGGVALVSFSNRCFPTKAVKCWVDSDDVGRMGIVSKYYHYSASWRSIEALDVRLRRSFETVAEFVQDPESVLRWFAICIFRGTWKNDPIYVVKAVK